MSPFFVEDRAEPYRAEMVLWLEVPDGVVVGTEVIAPEDGPGAVAKVLQAAIQKPATGSPRCPDRLRVADNALANEVRAVVGDGIPIQVAPTPELDAFLRVLIETMEKEGPEGAEEDSYLEGGRIPAATMHALFQAAQTLFRLAPWKTVTDDQVIRMDIPALGVEGACISIIGNLGESLGLLIFPSLVGFVAFAEASAQSTDPNQPLDLGTDWLALNFDRGADLPATMRREVAAHNWPVAAADAYPRVARFHPDVVMVPLCERDVKIAAACASALAAFFPKHRRLFASAPFVPVCESFFDEDDLEVRFTVPYEAFPEFRIADSPPPAQPADAPIDIPKVKRNAPCPCGSGRKYKHCHYRKHKEEQAARVAPNNDVEDRLIDKLMNFARTRFGSEWRGLALDFQDVEQTLQLAVPWALYGYEVDGASVLTWYLKDHGSRLSPAESEFAAAQQAAWLSVWEVVAVEPGASLTLRDLLSLEERHVREVSGSRTLVVRDAILARVIDHQRGSLLSGVHPRPLPPEDTAEVVRLARGRLRLKRAVPVSKLREGRFGSYLISKWEEAVFELDLEASLPRSLSNTDGDPLLLTTDHFDLEPGAGPKAAARLAEMDGVEPPEPGEDPPMFVFTRPGNPVNKDWNNTIIGHCWVENTALKLETNSERRADTLRAQVEAACTGLIRFRVREHTDPLSSRFTSRGKSVPSLPTAEERQLTHEFKQHHYAQWPDHPLPALDGRTPRQAARTARGRRELDVLLKTMENQENRFAGPDAFDFSGLRRELGLE